MTVEPRFAEGPVLRTAALRLPASTCLGTGSQLNNQITARSKLKARSRNGPCMIRHSSVGQKLSTQPCKYPPAEPGALGIGPLEDRRASFRVRGGSRSEVSAMGDRRICQTF